MRLLADDVAAGIGGDARGEMVGDVVDRSRRGGRSGERGESWGPA